MNLTENKKRYISSENVTLRKVRETDVLSKEMATYLKNIKEEGFFSWLILLKGTNDIIGTISIKVISDRNRVLQFTSTIKKEIKKDYSGYRVEALKVLSDYTINVLKYNRLQIICPTNNRDCETTAVRAGFLKETNIKEYFFDERCGIYVDGSVFCRFNHREKLITVLHL